MAEESKPSVYPDLVKGTMNANGRDGWTPVRYSMLYAYVAMYHRVRGNPHLYGLTEDGLKKNSNPNQVIFEKVKENFGKLWNELELNKMGHLLDKGEMFKDIDYLDSHAREFSSALIESGKLEAGKMMTMANADYILKMKADKCSEKFRKVKSAADYMPNWMDKEGKDSAENGYTGIKYEEAKRLRKEKRAPLRRARWKQLLFGLLGVAAVAGTVVGLGALIGGGGALLSGIFGGVFSAGTLGGAAAGAAGMVAGGFLSKTFLGKFLDARAQKLKFKKDYKDFMRGEGKYVTKDKRPQGYKGIRAERHDQLVAKAIMTSLYSDFYNDYIKSRNLEASVTLKFGKMSKTFANGYKELQDRKFELLSKGSLTDDEKIELAAVTQRIKDYKVSEPDIINAYTNYLRTHTNEINRNLSFRDDKTLGKLDISKYIKRCIDLREIAKETVYNSQVADTKKVKGVMAQIRSVIEHKVSWADEINMETTAEKIENVENSINYSKGMEDISKPAEMTRSSFNNLMTNYETLLLQEDDFNKQQAQAQYINLKRKLCDAIVENLRSIVDKPLDSETKKHIEDALQEGSKSLDAIKNSSHNGDLEELQSLAAFIEKETNSDNPTSMVSTDIGATISEQFNFNENSLKTACIRMGANEADISEIARRISLMKSKGETSDIEIAINAIDTKPENRVASRYLRYMLKRKDKQANVDLTGFNADFKKKLENLTIEDINNNEADSKIEKIKKEIDGMTISDAEKKKYNKALLSQMQSLNYREKLNNTANAWPSIKTLQDADIIKHYKRISEITDYSDGFDKGEIVTSFITKFPKMQNTPLGKYMRMKLNEKITSIYKMEASKVGKYSNDIEGITKLLKNVNDSKLLTKVQKDDIISTMGNSIKTSLQTEMRNLSETLFTNAGSRFEAETYATGLSKRYQKYLTETMLGQGKDVGFAEFFNLKTEESEDLKKQVKNLYTTIQDIPKFLTVSAKKQDAVFDAKSKDSRVIIDAFYTKLDKGQDSALYQFASKVDDTYINNISKDDFTAGKINTKIYNYDVSTSEESGILVDLKKKLDEVDSLPKEDQLAAVALIKQRCIGLFRSQIMAELEEFGYSDGVAIDRTTLGEAIKNANKLLPEFNEHLFSAVNKKIKELGGKIDNISQEIDNGLRGDKVINFVKTAKSEQMGMGG